MTNIDLPRVSVTALFKKEMPEIAGAKDKKLVIDQNMRSIKLGESAKAGKLKFARLSDTQRAYKNGEPKASERAEEIVKRAIAAQEQLSGLAAKALTDAIETKFKSVSPTQEKGLTAICVGFREDMRKEMGAFLLRGKDDALSGLDYLTVKDIKVAVSHAEEIANRRVAKDIGKIRALGVNNGGGVRRLMAAKQIKTMASINAFTARLAAESEIPRNLPDIAASLNDPGRNERYRKALDAFEVRVEKNVTAFLTQKFEDHGRLGQADFKQADALGENMLADMIARHKAKPAGAETKAATAEEPQSADGAPPKSRGAEAVDAPKVDPAGIPKIRKEKAEAAVSRFDQGARKPGARVTFSESQRLENAKAGLRARVEQAVDEILLSANPGDLDRKIDEMVKDAASAYRNG